MMQAQLGMRAQLGVILMGGIAMTLAACAKPAPTTPANYTGFVQGQARVISVDQELGQALLEIGGRKVYGYWERDSSLAQGGAVVQNGALKPPVANYHEKIAVRQQFPAAAGDLIAYVGFQTGREILLRGVAVVQP